MYSGHGERYADNSTAYKGYPAGVTDDSPPEVKIRSTNHPGFSGEAAQWLVENR